MTKPAEPGRAILQPLIALIALLAVSWGLLHFLSNHTSFLYTIRGMKGSVPPLGTLIDPHHGLWYTARSARAHDETISIDGLKEPVTVVRDERGVPHIFAESDRDAVIASGYVVAQDRLFQLDFIPRAASGSLAEVFGPDLISTDRYLRSTGMDWAARANLDSIRLENGIENDLLEWFSAGATAYIERLESYELPLEFRLIGYTPNRYTPLDMIRVLQYMSFDLSFRTDDISYAAPRRMLNSEDYDRLYPIQGSLFVPIVREPVGVPSSNQLRTGASGADSTVLGSGGAASGDRDFALSDKRFPGFVPGKGSNNWAVTGSRSETGGALLAGDMHLELTLPAIWYEIHLIAPGMDTRGVTIPGAPLPVEGFTGGHGWTFTNTGADQIDHYELLIDSSRTHYRHNEKWVPFELLVDTIHVRNDRSLADTLRLTRFGPVMGWPVHPVAVQWTAHKRARTLRALWEMNRADGLAAFQQALGFWDTPMQNILYADTAGNISIRSTGHLPIRKSGHGAGLLPGSGDGFDWIGRVPFEELPYAENPETGYLASANQRPAGSWYPYYLGHDWYRSYRSLRIDDLLSSKPRHGMSDMKAYQSDVHVVQRDLFVPMLDTLTGLSEDARTLRRLLASWDGRANLAQSAALVLDEYLGILEKLAWDEFYTENIRRPRQSQLYSLLTEEPDSRWLDIQETDLRRETAADLVRIAIEATADTLRSKYGWSREGWRWRDHHKLLVRHLTKSDALSALDAGPFPYPGFANTLSPAAQRTTTESASWRMIVDFSTSPPEAVGVYPGGQSGNPFSVHYADNIAMFLHFGYYDLPRPATPEQVGPLDETTLLSLTPNIRHR
jgi:penicillin amidase